MRMKSSIKYIFFNKPEKVFVFELLVWTSLGSIITSGWLIAIPLWIFPKSDT